MTYAVGGLLVLVLLVLWWLYDIRRVIRLRFAPSVIGPSDATITHPDTFRGAVAPNSYVVIRWPQGVYHYQGCQPALARQTYEHQHPVPGEAVEIWDQRVCRGHKEA